MRYGVLLPCDAMALMVLVHCYWLFFDTTRSRNGADEGTGVLGNWLVAVEDGFEGDVGPYSARVSSAFCERTVPVRSRPAKRPWLRE